MHASEQQNPVQLIIPHQNVKIVRAAPQGLHSPHKKRGRRQNNYGYTIYYFIYDLFAVFILIIADYINFA